ncbi:AAA-domain-containing protein [Schizopora paradoxa]|uniref:AAA-domain-containing protein n=1 Tax=Schizopora paradoxa TaxID=27342 RepID=A0A0H2RL64_9AGAM|nr:AAA-domain-containing protein [Schizopora paradoxa]
MRTSSLVPPTRSALKQRTTNAAIRRVLFSQSHKPRCPSKGGSSAVGSNRRALSSSKPWSKDVEHAQLTTAPIVSDSGPPAEGPVPSDDPGEESNVVVLEVEKVKRARRSTPKAEDVTPLPPGLNILWTPDSNEPSTSSYSSEACSPARELFEHVLSNFLITMLPQTQHRAAYATSSGSLVEPTHALHCPIEGGDYIIDETVRELARGVDAEVITLDAAQLAAGEWGAFGKSAEAALKLPQNPLHFRSYTNVENEYEEDDGEEDDNPFRTMPPSGKFMIRVVADGPGGMPGKRQAPVARSAASSKAKAFFDNIINIPSPDPEKNRPRIIYIRDYPLLAPSASSWYPSLLASVRQRRQGPIARPTSPVANPVTIIFGMTPPMMQSSSPASSSSAGKGKRPSPQALLGLLNSRQPSDIVVSPPQKPSRHEGDSEDAEKARERRLRDRMMRWMKEDPSFYDDLPPLPDLVSESTPSSAPVPSGVIVGSPMMGGLPPGISAAIQSMIGGSMSNDNRDGDRDADDVNNTQYFRTSVIIPEVRNVAEEREARNFRRIELNLLITRMALGELGARIDETDPGEIYESLSPPREGELAGEGGKKIIEEMLWDSMWRDWAEHIQPWSIAKHIADTAVGIMLASNGLHRAKTLPDSLPIPWTVITHVWRSTQLRKDCRKDALKQAWSKVEGSQKLFEDTEENEQVESDRVVEDVKENPDLSAHERRLLSCIVDSASMPTSFSQVHLPDSTIDSVRTIVSLPLLHPSAFQQGILKQHSMTGCLLFGPPGTGKTLVVRALAKEAGCRMLAVAPSDVMDMYVGEGEKLVRSVFSLARRLSPCVIFLDEIDALFGARSSARETGGAMAHHGVITEFMQEMDGLKTNKETNVIVIGATNRPFDLDDAVLRRLPRRLLVDLPGEKERKAIMKILLRDEILADDVDLAALAKRTDLFSGSDLKHLCVSAALDAVKEGVKLPWAVPTSTSQKSQSTQTSEAPLSDQKSAGEPINPPHEADANSSEGTVDVPRVLHLRHFTKALKEITPSSSESLGTLTALRKWNEEFGEGHTKKKKIMWGKGLFGFAEKGAETHAAPDGKVSAGP